MRAESLHEGGVGRMYSMVSAVSKHALSDGWDVV